MRIRVAVADLGLQLVQVKGAVREVGHCGGVNPSELLAQPEISASNNVSIQALYSLVIT